MCSLVERLLICIHFDPADPYYRVVGQAPLVPENEALVQTGHWDVFSGHGMCGWMKSWNLKCGLGAGWEDHQRRD